MLRWVLRGVVGVYWVQGARCKERQGKERKIAVEKKQADHLHR